MTRFALPAAAAAALIGATASAAPVTFDFRTATTAGSTASASTADGNVNLTGAVDAAAAAGTIEFGTSNSAATGGIGIRVTGVGGFGSSLNTLNTLSSQGNLLNEGVILSFTDTAGNAVDVDILGIELAQFDELDLAGVVGGGTTSLLTAGSTDLSATPITVSAGNSLTIFASNGDFRLQELTVDFGGDVVIPEPATAGLAGLGLLALAARRRRA